MVVASDLLSGTMKMEQKDALIHNMQRVSSNLDKRINELVNLSKIEMGILRVRLKKVEAINLIREIIDSKKPRIIQKSQNLIVNLPDSPVIVRLDVRLITQVLLNLLDNAIKFTPKGGNLEVTGRVENKNLIIAVQDSGPGISSTAQKRLFKPYYHRATDQKQYSGLGLGLALCKNYIDLHKGQIGVKSKQGKGSIFGFSIPLSAVKSTQAKNSL